MEYEDSLFDLVSNFEDFVEEDMKAAISNGVDVHARNSNDYSLLMLAAHFSNDIPVKYLLAAGANPNETRDESLCSKFEVGLTPFLYAVIEGSSESVKLMLENSADINTKNGLGSMALDLAAGNGAVEMLKLLLNYSPDIDHLDNLGHSAVMCAAESGHFRCVQLLVEAGARLDLISKRNKSILDLANTKEIKSYLEEKCSDIDFELLQKLPEENSENYSTEEVLKMLDATQRMMHNPLWRYWYRAKQLLTGKKY